MVKLLPYQRAALLTPARFTWNCWARQTGKSFTFGLKRLMRAMSRKRQQIILSAGERQSREVMNKVRQHCESLKIWYEWHGEGVFQDTTIRQLEIHLENNVRLIGLPANPMTARGFSGDVFLDEFAMHGEDEAIWAALYPTTLRGGGELDIASTPRGRKNLFYRMCESQVFDTRVLTLADAIEQGLDVDLESVRAGVADDCIWRQEFCCEFLDEATSFMTHALIRSCQDSRLSTDIDWPALRRRGAEVYMGVDIGRRHDLTVIWLWEREGDRLVTRGALTLGQTPFSEQENRIAALLAMESVKTCCIDATGMGLHLAESLARRFGDFRVEAIVFTAAIKNELAGRLRVFAERGHIAIPPDEAIVDDWHALSRVVTDHGSIRLEADRAHGGHADRFWAAALGLHAARDPAGEIGFIPGPRLSFAGSVLW